MAPRLAIWFLDRLLAGPGREYLIGDLIEQNIAGRSRAWFWRQAVGSIVVTAARDLRAHKILALTAVVAFSVIELGLRFFNPSLWALDVMRMGLDRGWMWREAHYPFLALNAFQTLAIGWIIGRLHRPHQGTVVLGLTTFLLLTEIPIGVRLVGDVFQHLRYLPYLLAWAARNGSMSLAFVVGGALSAPTRARSELETC